MSKRLFAAAFVVGLAAVAWVGFGFAGTHALALAMTAVIGAVYVFGAWELRQFRADSAALAQALEQAAAQPPGSMADWLDRVPATLRTAVRSRLEGERAALPAPALTPYLVGLLVMLGMLGTFLGMVVTFQGAVFALQGSTDLHAIRGALAEPIRGLGLSFGTSIAGVAASAMLGLMSAIARRERMDLARLLEQRVAGTLRPFSFLHQREETFRALQAQATALPEVVDRLQALIEGIEQRCQQLDERLLAGQAKFHAEATQSYQQLATAVGASMERSLVAAATAAGDSIRPVLASTMDRVAEEAQRHHARLAEAAAQQTAQLVESTQAKVEALAAAFEQRSAAVVASVGQAAQASQQAQAAGERERLAAWTQSLEALGSRLEAQWQRLAQDTVQQMAALGGAMEAPVQRLLQTASEVPAAAAEVLAQLRAEVGRTAERDQLALQERTMLLEKLATVLQEVQHAAGAQRDAIASLVQQATRLLEQASTQFTGTLQAQAGQAAEAAAHVAATSVEMSSLAQAFGQGVQQFQASNEKVLGTLAQLEATLQRSIERSDEQLAYYVAQAREVIDLSIAANADIVAQMRQLAARKPAARSAEAAA